MKKYVLVWMVILGVLVPIVAYAAMVAGPGVSQNEQMRSKGQRSDFQRLNNKQTTPLGLMKEGEGAFDPMTVTDQQLEQMIRANVENLVNEGWKVRKTEAMIELKSKDENTRVVVNKRGTNVTQRTEEGIKRKEIISLSDNKSILVTKEKIINWKATGALSKKAASKLTTLLNNPTTAELFISFDSQTKDVQMMQVKNAGEGGLIVDLFVVHQGGVWRPAGISLKELIYKESSELDELGSIYPVEPSTFVDEAISFSDPNQFVAIIDLVEKKTPGFAAKVKNELAMRAAVIEDPSGVSIATVFEGYKAEKLLNVFEQSFTKK